MKATGVWMESSTACGLGGLFGIMPTPDVPDHQRLDPRVAGHVQVCTPPQDWPITATLLRSRRP
jgi:hypothetical protein